MRIDPHSAMKDTHVPSYCLPEFGKDGVVKGDLKDGYFVPAGAMLPCKPPSDPPEVERCGIEIEY